MDIKIFNKKGFTVAEISVVILILSLIIAATAPLITKRTKFASAAKTWQYSPSNANHIYYGSNTSTESEFGAAIGVDTFSSTDSAKLLINTANSEQSHILFKEGNVATGKIIMDGRYNIGLGYGITLPTGAGAPTYTIALGAYTTAIGQNSIAAGSWANATQENCIAIGHYANATTAANATAVGTYANAWGANASAMGYFANAGTNSASIGTLANSIDNSSAIGANSISYSNSTAIGYYANAYSTNSVAIGYNANTATGANPTARSGAIAIGTNTIAYGNNSLAIGKNSNAYGANSLAILSGQVTGTDSMAIGVGSVCTGSNSFAVGYLANAGATNSLAWGVGATAIAENTIALGSESHASGTNSIAIGYLANATGSNSVAIGYNAKTTLANEITIGDSNAHVYIANALRVAGTSFVVDGSGYWTNSDKRLKNVLGKYIEGLEKIKQIKIYNYTFKNDKDKIQRVGVIAQDLRKIFPNAVTKNGNGYLIIRQEDMFYAMINAIKQLDVIAQNLSNKIKNIIVKIKLLDNNITALININQTNSKELNKLEIENKELKSRIYKLKKQVGGQG